MENNKENNNIPESISDNTKTEDNSHHDKDIKELSDAFENYMDNIINEEIKEKINFYILMMQAL